MVALASDHQKAEMVCPARGLHLEEMAALASDHRMAEMAVLGLGSDHHLEEMAALAS